MELIVFDKSNEQNNAYFSFALARKRTIEPYLRDLRVHLLNSVGLQGCVKYLSAPAICIGCEKRPEERCFLKSNIQHMITF